MTTTYYKVSDRGFYTNGGNEKFEKLEDAISRAIEVETANKKKYFFGYASTSVIRFTESVESWGQQLGTIEVWNSIVNM